MKKIMMTRDRNENGPWELYTKEDQEKPVDYDNFETGIVYRYEYMVFEVEGDAE